MNSISNNISSIEVALLALGLTLLSTLSYFFLDILGVILFLIFSIVLFLIPFLRRIEGSFLLIYFFSALFVIDRRDGIPIIEIPFFILSLILILYVYYSIIIGSIKLENSFDYAFLLFHILIPYGVLVGNINGAEFYSTISEIKYFIGIYTYFPLRRYLTKPNFRKMLMSILILILAYVLIRNFYYYQKIILQAVVSWQAEKARVATNELIIVSGLSIFLSYYSLSHNKVIQIFSYLLFFLFLLSLIITQSRGFWIAAFLSSCSIFVLSTKESKKRIFVSFFITLTIVTLSAFIFFNDLVYLIVNALSERFQSIGSGTQDTSLYDRWLETKTIFSLVIQNPIAGYGLGTEFTRKVVVFDHFIRTSYIHNGYLAVFYKFGILGFFLTSFIWYKIVREGTKTLLSQKNANSRIILTGIIGIVIGMFLLNLTSPIFLYFEGTLITTLFSAYVSSCTSFLD